MEMRASGPPKEGSQRRPGLVWPVLDCQLLPHVPGALLAKDQRHLGGALKCLKLLNNLSLQGFMKQNPWLVETQLENILLDEDSPAK